MITIPFEINGYTFGFQFGDFSGIDGVLVPGDAPYSDQNWLHSFEIALVEYRYFHTARWCSELIIQKPRDFENEQIADWIQKLDYVIEYSKSHLYRPTESEIATLNSIRKTFIAEQQRRERTVRPSKKPRPGYIYLVRAITPDNHYKIGLSKNPVTRIESMSVKLPFPIESIHQFPTNNMHIAERQLHERYADKRANGEWFQLTDQDVQDICGIERMDIEGVRS